MLIIGLVLTGCKSEIDKCVDALVKVAEQNEAYSRLTCLKAAAGKS